MVSIFKRVSPADVTPAFRDCISLLIDSGAEIGIASQDYYGDVFGGNTPYCYAFEMKDRELLKLFLDKGGMAPYAVEVFVPQIPF